MVPANKWIEGTSRDAPASAMARRVLEARLEAVVELLPLAAEPSPSERSIEWVHALRVASRRAVVALETFADFLSKRRARWVLKQVKRCRREAGAARDLDVLLGRLQAQFNEFLLARSVSEEFPEAGCESLLAEIRVNRQTAQEPILALHQRLSKKLSPRVKKLISQLPASADLEFGSFSLETMPREIRAAMARSLKALRKSLRSIDPEKLDEHARLIPGWNRKRFSEQIKNTSKMLAASLEPSQTFGQSARANLQPTVDRVFESDPANFADDAALHQLRIDTKRLRYMMEIFAGAFDPAFREGLYSEIVAIQDLLGRLNDHVVGMKRIGQWRRAARDPATARFLKQLLRTEAAARDACRQEFVQWWTAERIASIERQFKQFLAE